MTRWLVCAGACVLAGSMLLSARQAGGDGRGGQSPEMQQARAAMQRDVAEVKRLQEQLKRDRQAGDREMARHDAEALKIARDNVKRDQDVIRQLVQNRNGRAGGGAGSGRGGRGRSGS
jgi:hypothetical protein